MFDPVLLTLRSTPKRCRTARTGPKKSIMKSCGMDIHQAQTVFHCLDARGQMVERGRCATTAAALTAVYECGASSLIAPRAARRW